MSTKHAVIAAAVAGLFAAAPAALAKGKAHKKKADVVRCAGINECRGHGSCAGADNSCKSKNECKGKGWVETASTKECADKGGKLVASM